MNLMKAATSRLSLFSGKPVHLIGIGGAGMSGIAMLLISSNVAVTGSDLRDSGRLSKLRMLGAEITVGHDAARVGDVATVVVSTAIPENNPELLAARERGIPVLHRAEALAEIMDGSRIVAVAGTHGKTTTTAMLTAALQGCGCDPGFAIGGEMKNGGVFASKGSDTLFVCEADESDGSFLRLGAAVGIITNIEPDHLNYWGNFDSLVDAFRKFSLDIGERNGFLVACGDDEITRELIGLTRSCGLTVRSYGFSKDSDYRIGELVPNGYEGAFSFTVTGLINAQVSLQVPGEHNVLNATAALAAATELGFDATGVAMGLAGFTGTCRRLEFCGEADGVRVFDDFAHHPTEVRASLMALRRIAGQGRVIAAFQAHHYYRVAMFIGEFADSLSLADEVVVLEVHAPDEKPVPLADGQSLAKLISLPARRAVFEPHPERVPGYLASRARRGDVIITIGQGDVAAMPLTILALLHDSESSDPG